MKITSTKAVRAWRKKYRKYYLKGIKKYANQNPGYNNRIIIGVEEYRKAVKAYPKNKKCQLCGKISRKERLCLDHCHATSRFRGWICRLCNTGLGYFGDTVKSLNLAIKYLERFDDAGNE